ncbi:N-sulphoglucosamine sulphohydrolase [Strongylocentrotus purpuratus]|nr:N-sulphoglucosamine sulphohydrolase [Strongylocentrotus purpuratus]|eukprot:XP_794467.1 PREDICTED: N-sulphoglucosamine sulphohydrolase [Strongylocentrotus purpuratus]
MAVFVLLVCILLPLVSAQPPHDKRNVLLIIADDVGFETSVYNHTACKMPNLARLAQQSVTVRNAYTSVSSCSPSRSVILTGMPQHQNGMYGLHHQENHFMSFDTVKSLPLLLKPYGIHTGMIGKKHVGPKYVYKFDFERDSDTLNMLQCARNITQMKLYVREFFAQQNNTTPFMLYMGFNDAHRCGGQYGEFCEKFGNGEKGMGIIDDWKPVYYDPKDVEVPYFLPDTLTTRIDITKQYTSLSRLDAGISMLLAELERVGHLNDTLIVYTADNGIPFPNAKTNLFEPGMGEPMLISNPFDKHRWGQVSDAMTSTMDIVPTVLDWFGIPMPGEEEDETTKPIPKTKEFPTPDETIKQPSAALTGHSMVPITESEPGTGWDHVYASHNFHEVTMYYPMRVLRNRRYRLIHNLNNRAPYPLATDLYACPTFLEILNNTVSGKPTNWFKTLEDYYYRDEWELYDLQNDPHELINLADDPDHQEVRQNMTTQLHSWMMETADTWHCYPHGVRFGPDNGCGPMYNEPTQQGSPEINIIH